MCLDVSSGTCTCPKQYHNWSVPVRVNFLEKVNTRSSFFLAYQCHAIFLADPLVFSGFRRYKTDLHLLHSTETRSPFRKKWIISTDVLASMMIVRPARVIPPGTPPQRPTSANSSSHTSTGNQASLHKGPLDMAVAGAVSSPLHLVTLSESPCSNAIGAD
ncbi:hypothetical protein PAXRUDRAFT_554324 [Paxillus rubicundulus Ve08.2h10]|uniref:Uncharacterized protein n=1 Tax=Paxillus rubicundulus Ve08.2h10 TaxID=930991 RepID=A0A0D0DME8_9AGAM|nr:hypothetical protein PAXRUDRAFT_554324 [Paxillus rubicundulus Ve08.2h10]